MCAVGFVIFVCVFFSLKVGLVLYFSFETSTKTFRKLNVFEKEVHKIRFVGTLSDDFTVRIQDTEIY